MYENEITVCKYLAIEAGSAIMKIYEVGSAQNIKYKNDNSPLTAADEASNKIIVNGLKDHFPEYAILSEEEKDNKKRLNNDYCFVIDPLDGTKEFIKRNGQFTVNIALSYKHRVVMGVIYVPVTKELYFASLGAGAFYTNTKGETVQIHVSDNTDHNNLRTVVSSSHPCDEMEQIIKKYGIKNLIRMGSSLKGCLVAEGTADIYFRHNPTMEWDTAAMQCIVEEAGGIFKQMDDSEMTYNRECSVNDKGFYAINKLENRLH